MVTLHLASFDIRSLKTHGSCTWFDAREQEYQVELFINSESFLILIPL